MPTCLTIAGIQWGDEGKGKVTDLLAGTADVVVRYQGGANAGHTVVVAGRKIVLHQVPSGAMNPAAMCVVGPFVVLDPPTLASEIADLHKAGIGIGPDRLRISRAAHAVMPFHKALDKAREAARGAGRIGTTGRGIGPTYEDIASRMGVRLSDLVDADRLAARLDAVLPERNALLRHLGAEEVARDEVMDEALGWGRFLAPFLADTGAVVHEALAGGRRVLFESAQGTLLDILHGTYPFVTSSFTTAPAAFALSGVGTPRDHSVLGVMKAYTTRVGSGPFPTEDHGAFGKRLRDVGGEYGATTGRPRRCGALDLPLLRYAVRVNGVDRLAIMKMDVLSGLAQVPVCTAYRAADGTLACEVHPDRLAEPGLVPVLEDWPGWEAPVAGLRDASALPATARDYVARIEAALGRPALLVSTGSDRDHGVLAGDPWA